MKYNVNAFDSETKFITHGAIMRGKKRKLIQKWTKINSLNFSFIRVPFDTTSAWIC